ncbi:LLM class flavin-dependent oxidoreductase [Amycolatopsis lurida]
MDAGGLEFSCALPPGPEFAGLAVLAEELGYARVWVLDSAPLWEDSFVHLAFAAERTTRIELGVALLVPAQRSVMAMASAIATTARVSGGRFRACFGSGFTARVAMGCRPLTLRALSGYVTAVRQLLLGKLAIVDGVPVRMLHAAGPAESGPVDVPLWLSVVGTRGTALAGEIADGVIGSSHPALPAAVIVSGTVLEPGEDPGSDLPSFEGRATHHVEHVQLLLDHLEAETIVGDAKSAQHQLMRLAEPGFGEIIYTPTGPDVRRELCAFAAARPPAEPRRRNDA